MSRPLYEPSFSAAARIVGAHYGYHGKVGGWIYNRHGRPVCQGWRSWNDLAGGPVVRKDVTDPASHG